MRWAKGVRFVSYNRVYAELDLHDTVGHAVNAYPDSLAFTATKKSVNRFLSMRSSRRPTCSRRSAPSPAASVPASRSPSACSPGRR